MLVLTRKLGESVCVGSALVVKVLSVQGGRVKLGFSGPPDIVVQRSEICDANRLAVDPVPRLASAETAEVDVLHSAAV